jgi:large subunit ribosomal protein L22
MSKSSHPRRLALNEAGARLETVRTSPRKLNLVAQTIRGKPVGDALIILTASRRRIANQVIKALQGAVANAENNHQLDIDRLVVAEASVGRATVMKRWRARARGRVARIEKPFSHLNIVVREAEEA